MRHVFIEAATGGAVIMLLLTIGLLVLGWFARPNAGQKRQAAARPKRQAVPRPKREAVPRPKREAVRKPKRQVVPAPKLQVVPAIGPDQDDDLAKTASYPSWLDEITELDDDSSAATSVEEADDEAGTGSYSSADDFSSADSEIAAPSWLGLADPLPEPGPLPEPELLREPEPLPEAEPLPEPDLATTSQPTELPAASAPDDELSWPDFLALPDDAEEAATQPVSEVPHTPEPPHSPEPAHAPEPTHAPEPAYTPEPAESALSPTALRMLGASPLPQPGDDELPLQRHQVALGDDQIEIVLRDPAESNLAWAPLPYDIPDDGLAFACVGAGDEGCLFIDLAAAPSAVEIGGDPDAAVRLAESIAHQLCALATAKRAISVLLVGDAIPEPHPANAISLESLRDLAPASLDGDPESTDIVFCELRTNEDAFALARHVTSSRRHVVPVVLGNLPGAAWSLTADANPPLDETLPPLDSIFAGTSNPYA